MTTLIEFELNGIKYSENNGRYYKTEGGKKTRVSKATYEEAAAEWTEMVKGKAEQDAEQDEIDTITNEMTDKNEETKLPKGVRIESMYDGDTFIFMVMRGEEHVSSHWTRESAFEAAMKLEPVEPKEENTEELGLPKEFTIEPERNGDTISYRLYRNGAYVSSHQHYEDAESEAIKTVTAERVEEIEKSEETTKTEKPKKQNKPRKSKDIAHESKYGVTLTAKQVDFMKHLPDSDFWTNGKDSEIWVDCLCDEIGGQFANKPMTVGAMISTLCEKRLGVRCRQKVNGRMATSFKLTDLGKMVVSELGID